MRTTRIVLAWLAGIAAGLLLLLAAAGIALALLMRQPGGRAWIERETVRLSGGHVRIEGLSGSLTSLQVAQLQLVDRDGTWLRATGIALRWSPAALLERRIHVDSLVCAQLGITRGPVSNSSGATRVSIPRVDVEQLSIGALQLGPELAGTATSLQVAGRVHLRSLRDANVALAAHRTGGVGDYELQLRFDRRRMQAALRLQEPAGGPLAHLIGLPGLGALSVTGSLDGPRAQERVRLALTAGAMRGNVGGTLDLEHSSAVLDYILDAPATRLRPDLGWDSLTLQGRFQGPFKAPLASGRLQSRGLQLPDAVSMDALDADLQAHGGALVTDATATALVIPGAQPRLLAAAPLQLHASMRLDEAARPLQLQLTHALLQLDAQVDRTRAAAGAAQTARVQVTLPDLSPLAQLASQTLKGSARLQGTLRRASGTLRVELAGGVAVTAGAPWAGLLGRAARLQLAASLPAGRLTVSRLQLDGATLALSGSGSAGLEATGAGIDARWTLALRDLAQLTPQAAGTLTASGRVSGPRTALDATLRLTSTLSVRGSPSGTLTAAVKASGLPSAPAGTVQAQGTLAGAPLVLDVGVDRARSGGLRALIRQGQWRSLQLGGGAVSDTDFTHARGRFTLQVARLADLQPLVGVPLSGSLSGAVVLAAGGSAGSQARLQLVAHDVVVNGITGDAQLSAEGTPAAVSLKLQAQVPQLYGSAAQLESAAVLDLPARQLRIDAARLGYREQTYQLLQPAMVSFADGVVLDGLHLGAGPDAAKDAGRGAGNNAAQAVLVASGRLAPQLDLRATLQHLGPQLIDSFVPDLLASGDISAQAQVTGVGAQLTGQMTLDAVGLRAGSDTAAGLPASDLHASATLAAGVAQLQAAFAAGDGATLKLSGHAPLVRGGALDLTAAGALNVALLNPLLEANGRRASGRLALDAQVTGTAAAPQISGRLVLSRGDWRDYALGMHLGDISGEFVGSGGTLQVKSLTARASPGSVSVTGSIGLLQSGLPVDLKVTARDAQPITSPLITARLDAALTLTGKARERLNIGGEVNISRAVIGIPNSFPADVAVLDVRRPGQVIAVQATPLPIGLNVRLIAPRQILVQGRGLDAELGGEIRLRGTRAEPRVSGGFDLQRGSFTLAGSRLKFTQGRVSFNGSGLKRRIDPTLDFTAKATTSGNVTAQLRVTGLADAPQFELSSVPELSQDEILARLLFGESVTQLSALQAAQIGAALVTLGGVGGSGLDPLAKLQRELGLDRLSVSSNNGTSTGADTGTSLEAGRYVSDRVYVGARQSTSGFSQLEVDVDLSQHLKVQTRLGNGTASAQGTTPENDPGSSVGLSYEFEY